MRYIVAQGLEVAGTLTLIRIDANFDYLPGTEIEFKGCRIESLPSIIDVECAVITSTFQDGSLMGTYFGGPVKMVSCEGTKIGNGTVFKQGLRLSMSDGSEKPFVFENGYRMLSPLSIAGTPVLFGESFSSSSDVMVVRNDEVTMPVHMDIEGDLIVEDCRFEKWPRDLFVAGSRDIKYVKVKRRSLPDEGGPGLERRMEMFGRIDGPSIMKPMPMWAGR